MDKWQMVRRTGMESKSTFQTLPSGRGSLFLVLKMATFISNLPPSSTMACLSRESTKEKDICSVLPQSTRATSAREERKEPDGKSSPTRTSIKDSISTISLMDRDP